MASVLGFNAKAYHNTGSYASPVWNEIPGIRDLTIALEKNKADVTTRGAAGWRTNVGVLKDGTVSFGMVYDPADADFVTLRNAFLNNTNIDMLFLDGGVAVTGSTGFRFVCQVFKFERTENLEEPLMVNVEVGPTYTTDTAAQAWTV